MKSCHTRIIIKAPEIYITMQVVEFKMHYDTMNAKEQTPPQNRPRGLITPNSPRKVAKREESSALVKISATCCSDSTK